MKPYLAKNKSTYDQLAGEFREKIELRLPNDKKIIDKFALFLPPTNSKRPKILDLGPGNGNMCKLLSERKCDVSAIEISPKMAKIAQENAKGISVIVGDFLSHNFVTKFDGILATAFIHLFNARDVREVLRKIGDMLKENGIAYISTTKHAKSDEGYFVKDNFDKKVKRYRHRYTKVELRKLLMDNGFEIIDYSEETNSEVKDKIWMDFIVRKSTTN